MRPTPRSTLTVAALGTMLALVSFSAPVAAIGPISQALGADVAGRTWMVSAMSIGLGATLLTAGTLADDRGRRRVFVIGLVVLALSSAAGAVAASPLVFTLARAAQGVGDAAVVAASLGLIAATFAPGSGPGAASGVWGASVGAGIMVGPLLTSELDRYASWRYAYALIAVAAVALAVVARRRVPESTRGTRRGLDLPGAVTFAGAVCAFLAGLVEGRLGWGRPVVLVLFVLAAVLFAAFVLVELRSARPMLDLRLFRRARLRRGHRRRFRRGRWRHRARAEPPRAPRAGLRRARHDLRLSRRRLVGHRASSRRWRPAGCRRGFRDARSWALPCWGSPPGS